MKHKASCQLWAGHQGSVAGKEKGSWLSQLFSQQIPSLLLYIGLFNCNRENNLDNFALERVN